jgi:hypothetical protein
MLDVPGIRIVRTKSLRVRSEHQLRTESGSSNDSDCTRVYSLLG